MCRPFTCTNCCLRHYSERKGAKSLNVPFKLFISERFALNQAVQWDVFSLSSCRFAAQSRALHHNLHPVSAQLFLIIPSFKLCPLSFNTQPTTYLLSSPTHPFSIVNKNKIPWALPLSSSLGFVTTSFSPSPLQMIFVCSCLSIFSDFSSR